MAYAKALRATEQRAQAVAVLQQAAMRSPHDMKLIGAYGRALADAGEYAEALDALGRAHTPDNPDWRILNAQGAVLDQMGRHAEAQRHYAAALKIVPDEPSVFSNLGLSYALEKQLNAPSPRCAKRWRNRTPPEGAAEPGARGRAGRALRRGREIAGADLPKDEAAANVAYLRQMLAQHGAWTEKGRPPLRARARRRDLSAKFYEDLGLACRIAVHSRGVNGSP